MIKKTVGLWIVIVLVTFLYETAHSCVGRVLYVGSLNSIEDNVIGELLVLLINERTGTNVQMRYFDNNEQLYKALKLDSEDERVDIIIENTTEALKHFDKGRLSDPYQEYVLVKDLYERKLDIIWLKPFGFNSDKISEVSKVSAPLLRRDVLTNFPLLPRILNKLAKFIDSEAYTDLSNKVQSGDKPKNVARDFLQAKKLI